MYGIDHGSFVCAERPSPVNVPTLDETFDVGVYFRHVW